MISFDCSQLNSTVISMKIRASSISSSSYSSISTSSFASSTNSIPSPSLNSSSSINSETRCEGLDLLVKAVLHVAGSVLGIRFTQRRVIRRRKRAFKFSKLFLTETGQKEEDEKRIKDEEIEVISRPKRRKRVMALPSKYLDSVIQPWKRQTRRPRSIEMDDGSG